jgi:hypothetical protein
MAEIMMRDAIRRTWNQDENAYTPAINGEVVFYADYADLERQLAEMTADRNLWKDDHDGDCPYKTQLADSRSQLAMKKWPTKYDELMCDPVFRAAYAKEWAITDGDNNLRMQLDDNPPQPDKPFTIAHPSSASTSGTMLDEARIPRSETSAFPQRFALPS